jgi:hypothetical protein
MDFFTTFVGQLGNNQCATKCATKNVPKLSTFKERTLTILKPLRQRSLACVSNSINDISPDGSQVSPGGSRKGVHTNSFFWLQTKGNQR